MARRSVRGKGEGRSAQVHVRIAESWPVEDGIAGGLKNHARRDGRKVGATACNLQTIYWLALNFYIFLRLTPLIFIHN